MMRLPLSVVLADPKLLDRRLYDQRFGRRQVVTTIETAQPRNPLPEGWAEVAGRQYRLPAPLAAGDAGAAAWDARRLCQQWEPRGLFIEVGGELVHSTTVQLNVSTWAPNADTLEMVIVVVEPVALPEPLRHAPIARMLLRDPAGATLTVDRTWWLRPDGTADTRHGWPDLEPRDPFLRQGELLASPHLHGDEAAGQRQWRLLAVALHQRAGGTVSHRVKERAMRI